MSELEKLVVAATEFLYCSVLYEWRGDAEDSDRHLVSGQICDVRSSIIIGNGGLLVEEETDSTEKDLLWTDGPYILVLHGKGLSAEELLEIARNVTW